MSQLYGHLNSGIFNVCTYVSENAQMLSKHVLVGSRAGTDVCVLDMDAPTVAYTNTGSTGASVPAGVLARAAADAEQGVLQCVRSHFLGFLGLQVCAPHVPAQTCVRTSACQRVQPCEGRAKPC